MTAPLLALDVVAAVGVMRYHWTFAYELGLELIWLLTVPVVFAVKMLP